MLNWYLVYTKARHEERLASRFESAGIEVFLPMYREQTVAAGKRVWKISPLFPCYMFIRMELTRHFRLVKYTRGVRRVLGSGNCPIEVPQEIIGSIRDRMQDGYVRQTPEDFSPGEEVIIRRGVFKDFNAVFEKRLNCHERVRVLLKTINTRAVLSSSDLAKCP